MNESGKIQNTKEYLKSLNEAKIKFSLSYKKEENSFVKDFFAIIIVMGILCVFFFDDSVFSISKKVGETKISGTGNYICETPHGDIADSLRPKEINNDVTLLKLNNEMIRLDEENIYIEKEKARLKNAIKTADVLREEALLQTRQNQYVKDLEAFRNKYISYQRDVEEYNAKVKTFNQYLEDNCEKTKHD